MALFPLSDLDLFLQSDVDVASATLMRTIATGVVTGHTGQHFEAATYTHVLPIAADRSIRIPQRPVTAVTSVTVAAVALTPVTDWVWDGISAYVTLDGFTPSSTWVATVVYTAGYATVPADVAAVALSIAGRLATVTPGTTSESIDDYRVAYADAGAGLSANEIMVLRRYKQRLGTVTVGAR